MPRRSRRRPTEPAADDPLEATLEGFWSSQALYAVLELGVVDSLADGARPVADLADRAGVDADRLRRVLRALAAMGLVTLGDGEAALTDAGRRLLDAELRDDVVAQIADRYLRADDLLTALQEETTAFHRRFGEEMFDYLDEHEQDRRLFTSAMTGMARHTVPAVVDALDLAGDELVVDVGGGEGSLAIALVKTYDDLEAIIVDRPQVAKQAKQRVQFGGLVERCRVVDGDFFEGVPTGADLYLLGRVLHDWDDDKARQLLANCAEAADAGARVVAAEEVIADDDAWSEAKMKDLMMMTMTGGKERTAAEYRALFEAAGLEWVGVTATDSEVSLVVGRTG